MSLYEGLRRLYIDMWNENPERVLPFLCESRVARQAFLAKYKELPPIENFPDIEKREWKKFVHELFPNKDVQFKLDAVKVIYTLGIITNS